jgi:hypothetical protein
LASGEIKSDMVWPLLDARAPGLDMTASDLETFVAALSALGAGWVALAQYRKAERWKRAEFAISQLRLLSSDDVISFCCRAIDWGVGPLPIPGKYRFLFPRHVVTVEHSWELMAEALRPDLTDSWNQPARAPQYLLYRYAFDDFFGYIDVLTLYRSAEVVSDGDFAALHPYLTQVRQPKYWEAEFARKHGLRKEQIFGDFVNRYYAERVAPWIEAVSAAGSEQLTLQLRRKR